MDKSMHGGHSDSVTPTSYRQYRGKVYRRRPKPVYHLGSTRRVYFLDAPENTYISSPNNNDMNNSGIGALLGSLVFMAIAVALGLWMFKKVG